MEGAGLDKDKGLGFRVLKQVGHHPLAEMRRMLSRIMRFEMRLNPEPCFPKPVKVSAGLGNVAVNFRESFLPMLPGFWGTFSGVPARRTGLWGLYWGI